MKSSCFAALLFIPAIAVSVPAYATITTIDISAEVNTHVSAAADTFPIGLSDGNQGVNVPFFTSAAPGATNLLGTWISSPFGPGSTTVTVPLTTLNIVGQASFYALLNNYYGTPGANEYNVTVNATNGDSVTYQSIGGVDTRDYNNATILQ